MADLLITIDGPAGSGKSTLAQMLANRLCAAVLDTGAMYRAVTLVAMRAGVDLSDAEQVLAVLDKTELVFAFSRDSMVVYIEDEEVTDKIRDPEVTANVKYIAASSKMRERLVKMQRNFAYPKHKIITEGRDQGTVVFPDAHLKFFLTADLDERSRRRHAELTVSGKAGEPAETRAALESRDQSDMSRSVGPLKPADDAIVIDTTAMTIEDVLEKLLYWVEKKCFADS
ncbi:MAG TPA: (d)CMP kinase [Sedimentisphaerales bacterium]|nr:(d)CMP kinase [Sedimentisphaerales bacterium]